MPRTERPVNGRILQAAVRFHGHLGPWLVLGLRAGTYARRLLKATPFNLSARVFCPPGPPHTCFLDGVQFSSGCTMGKGNIAHVRENCCRVEFSRSDAPGARLALELRPEVWAELHALKPGTRAGGARLGRAFHSRPFSSLFRASR